MDIPSLTRQLAANDPAERQAALDALRRIRRSASPHRRAALVALAEGGGWDALDEPDRRTVRRLINSKIGYEVPEPMHVCGTWFAVSTGNQSAVLDGFGLTGAVPVTMRLGAAAWYDTTHGASDSALIYVTPVLNGWTLLFGGFYDRYADWAAIGEGMAALSRRFGAAHCYNIFEGLTGWCIGEHGRLVRSYYIEDPDGQIGPPHPAESGFRLPHSRDEYPEAKPVLRLEGLVNMYRLLYFEDHKITFGDPDFPFAGQPVEALPAIFQAKVGEVVRYFGLDGTGEDWYPDEALADAELFDLATTYLATTLRATGRLDRYLQGNPTPRCYATDVAGRASVDPTELGPQVQVEGHAVLAWSNGSEVSPLSGLRCALPI
jgi:hypothetical protein